MSQQESQRKIQEKGPGSQAGKRGLFIAFSFGLLMVVGVVFQNCSDVEFASLMSEDEIRMDVRCEGNRCWDGKIMTDELTERPEIKVVFVVDNSFTMSQMQEKLAAGVTNLIDGLAGFTASFSIFTTTHDEEMSPLGFRHEKSAVARQAGCYEMRGGEMTLLDSCPGGSSRRLGSDYLNFTRYSLAPSLISPQDFRIREQSSSSELEDMRSRLSQAIVDVGIRGSDSERGVCSLVRAVYEEGETAPFRGADDFGVFVVISDEDDESSPEKCLSRIQQKTDCQEEDRTPTTETRQVVKTGEDAHRIFPVTYTVELGERNRFIESVTFRRYRNRRAVTWTTLAPQTYRHTLSFDYVILADGVPVPFSDSLVQSASAEACSPSACSAAQISAVTSAAQAKGGNLVAGSCRVTACQANPTPQPQERQKNVDWSFTCNSPLTESQCFSRLTNAERVNYVAGSCQEVAGTCRAVSFQTRNAVSPREVAQCPTATSCSNLNLNPGNGWLVEAGSCQENCASSPLGALTRTHREDHKTPAWSEDLSLCQRPYRNRANIGEHLSAANNNRPVLSCSAQVGEAKYETVAEQVTVYPPPGTPKCKALAEEQLSFPLGRKVEEEPDLTRAFVEKAKERFGSNYFVSALVHPRGDDPECPIQPGQSVGTEYVDLVQQTQGGSVHSICEPDYGVAFDGVSDWVQTSMANTYRAGDLDSSQGEIISVWLVREGLRNELKLNEDVEVRGANIRVLKEDLLQRGDELHYRVRRF